MNRTVIKKMAIVLALVACRSVHSLIYAGDCVCAEGSKIGIQIAKSGAGMVSAAQLGGHIAAGSIVGAQFGPQCTCVPQTLPAVQQKGMQISSMGGAGSAGTGSIATSMLQASQIASAAQAASTAHATQVAQIAQAAQAVQTAQAAQAAQAVQSAKIAQAAQAQESAQALQIVQALQQAQAQAIQAQQAAQAQAQAMQAQQAVQAQALQAQVQAIQLVPQTVQQVQVIPQTAHHISPIQMVPASVLTAGMGGLASLGSAGESAASSALSGAASSALNGAALFGIVSAGGVGGARECICPPVSVDMNSVFGSGSSAYEGGSSGVSHAGSAYALEAICMEKIKAAQTAANLQSIIASGSMNTCLDTLGRATATEGTQLAGLICYC